ncbi:MAG: RNA methyltransferase [candidate division Zixibacteria bacterium]|nr:RNA methyltransferase [candidate division Zixibacteria bacterium]
MADPTSWPIVSKAKAAQWRKLRTQKGRKQSGQLVIEGVRLVSEAIRSGCQVEALLAMNSKHGHEAAGRVLASVPSWTGITYRVPEREFGQMTDTTHSSGVAAVITWSPPSWESIGEIRAERVLFCDRVADPGNLGTLIRTAAGIGLDAIVTGPDSVEITNPKTMRASAGAVFRVPVIRVEKISGYVRWVRERSHAVYLADVHRGEQVPAEGVRKPWTLVIGGEVGMIDPAWSEAKPRYVTLPMKHGVESFNAAIAGAILMDRLCRTLAG